MITKTHALTIVGLVAVALSIGACGTTHSSSNGRASQPDVLAASTQANSRAVAPATTTAQGAATVSGPPDTLTIAIGVSTSAPHAAAALAQNNSLASAVQSALSKDGVANGDIQTSDLSLQQNWGTNGPDGYAASDQVTAIIRNLGAAGRIIDDALAPAGDAGRLNQVDFSMSNSNPYMSAARSQAVASALAQAQQMAAALGDHLGPLVSLTEVTPQQNTGINEFAPAASSGSAVPLQAGTQQVTVQVTGVWEVLPGR